MAPGAAFEAYCIAWIAGDHVAMAELFTVDGVFEASTLDRPAKGCAELLSQLHWIARARRTSSPKPGMPSMSGKSAVSKALNHGEVIGTGGKITRLAEIYDARPLFPKERHRRSPINRATPYAGRTVEAGAMEWSTYNNMHFPMIYSRTPHEDYVALEKTQADGVKQHSLGLLFEGEVSRLEWWDLKGGSGRKGEMRWALHSFELGQDIGIAVVDKAVGIGDHVEITHLNGVTRA